MMAWVTGNSYSNASSTSSTTGNVWYSWVNTAANCTSTCPTTSCSTSTVWTYWVEEDQDTAGSNYRYQQQIAQQQAEQILRDTERVAAQKAASEKAMALLRENLSKKQLEALDKHGWFLVEGGRSKKQYRIQGNRFAGNIVELDEKGDVARYCVHASYEYQLGDQLLAQAISLKYDEEHLLKLANRTVIRQAA